MPILFAKYRQLVSFGLASFLSAIFLSAAFRVAVFLALLASSKQAYAQGAASGGGSLLQGLMPLLLIVVVMYFLLIRPQQKRQRQHRELVACLKRGDKVLTSGGFYAVVTRTIDERDIEVELASKLKVKMVRSSVLELVASPQPVKRR